jgi:hypothetical protein
MIFLATFEHEHYQMASKYGINLQIYITYVAKGTDAVLCIKGRKIILAHITTRPRLYFSWDVYSNDLAFIHV